jgi:SAM-dependent methyltransferase
MIERARATARRSGVANAEFRLGEIEHLPVADRSVDAVISNCVINLSPEKAQVFREVRRVLRPGGRLVVSDLVWERPVSSDLRARVDALCGCVAGASLKPDYLRLIEDAGFRDVEVLEENRYAEGIAAPEDDDAVQRAMSAVVSIKVRAVAPAA